MNRVRQTCLLKWHLFLLGIFLFFWNVSIAWANDAHGGFVWQVTAPNQTTSYLIGTIHTGKKGSTLHPDYAQALQHSRLLVVESREEDWQGVDGIANVMALQVMIHDEKSLHAHWGEKRVAALNRLLSQHGSAVVLDGDAHIAPWMAYMMMVTDYNFAEYSIEYGVDALLNQAAKKQQKAVLSLETLEPIVAFMQIPKAVLLRGVDSSLQHYEPALQEQLKLLQLYQHENSRPFVQEILDQKAAVRYLAAQDQSFWQAFLYEDLLAQRNRAWMPKMERHFKQQPTTVAVGAAHLFGKDGLIVLLRERGFKVESVLAH
ncbi:TraB/GumN family protein [Vitreoscilla stercoraria]|uniref:TraB/GumN family protein n=1 Tax=Vitreoscilla stercoraria TaxID=61 RepID=A0ABY4E9D8_VITST|nr:TraB/GumN family protein [Vitreoscilla stercoraria]UOO91948.1 TraB/GumN family protein [Vitreoscilla stercoraria]